MRWQQRRAIAAVSLRPPPITEPGSSATEESLNRSLGKIKGELCIARAEHDDLAPLPMVGELRVLLGNSGAIGEIELYSGVHHGFAFPQRWCYDKHVAERHWERLISLYRRRRG
jgi:carboxymethylenebutenolidase